VYKDSKRGQNAGSFALIILGTSPVFAGLVVSGSVTQKGNQARLKQYYQGLNARLEFQSAPSVPIASFYSRGGTGTINVVDGARKSYLELQEKDVQNLGSLLGALPIKGPGGKPMKSP